jgi:hypothetical protein
VTGVQTCALPIFFNEAMGLNRGETPAAVLVGNSPEARRQRMLARLQKKQRDKNSS